MSIIFLCCAIAVLISKMQNGLVSTPADRNSRNTLHDATPSAIESLVMVSACKQHYLSWIIPLIGEVSFTKPRYH